MKTADEKTQTNGNGNGTHTPYEPDAQRIIDEVRAIMAREEISQFKVAKESGIKTTTLSLVMSGKYAADPKNITAALDKWLTSQRAKTTSRAMPKPKPYTKTPTGDRIFAALQYGQMAGRMVVVYGAAGLGKTATAVEFARRWPNAWIFTATAASGGSVSMCLENILLALGARDLPQGAARMERELIKRLTGRSGLLIVDEAQNLGLAALDEIRALHDASGVGVALLGNEVVYARLTGNKAAYLDRLFSRIGKRVHLKHAQPEDIANIAAPYGIRNDECLRVLKEIGARPGGLRSVIEVLCLALMMADNEPLAASHLKAAFRDLEG